MKKIVYILFFQYLIAQSIVNFDLNESSAFDSVRLYLQGKNLLTITDYTGYDPEMSGGVLGSGIDRGNYPTPRIVSVGLNVKF